MKIDHFTTTDLYRAGPLFNPDSMLRRDAMEALRHRKVADMVLAKRDEILREFELAKSHLKLRQRMLYEARKVAGMVYGRSVPRRLTPEDGTKIATRKCEVEFGHALDKLWAAQRAVAMLNHVYGELL
jgi:hypothetical protein